MSAPLRKKALAMLVLIIAAQFILWSAAFVLGSFGREMQMEHARATWEGVRSFATFATLIADGLIGGWVLVGWAIDELVNGSR